MSSQQSLHFPNRARIARATDPHTSHLSAEELTISGKRAAQKAAVYNAVLHNPDMTSFELAEHVNLDRYVVARRLPDLRSDGLVHNPNTRTCRITGRSALVWRVGRRK